MQGECRGRVALVAGAGSSTGIGFAAARILGREEAILAVTSTTDRIHRRAAELEAQSVVAVRKRPVARSIGGSMDITTELVLVPNA